MDDYTVDIIRTRYALVPRTLVFIRRGEQFLLIHKEKKDSYGYGKLNGVGGHLERGEDPYSSARREVYEETGLKVDNLDLAAIIFIDTNESPGIEVFLFNAEYCFGELRHSEEGELVWMTLNEISASSQILEDVPLLIEICMCHQCGEKPTMIKYTYNNNGKLRIDIVKE
jgi:8-oxo-dGTP diphosphatase